MATPEHCEACGLTAPADSLSLAVGTTVRDSHWTVGRDSNYGWTMHRCPEPEYHARMVRNQCQETRYLSIIPRLWRDSRFFDLTWWFLRLTNSGYKDRLFLMCVQPDVKPPIYKTLFSFKINPKEFALLCPSPKENHGHL